MSKLNENPEASISEENFVPEESKKKNREDLKSHLLALFGFCALSTTFFFLISIPVSFMPESWILKPQTSTIKYEITRLAKKLDAYRKEHGKYPDELRSLFDKDKRESDFQYETTDHWRNPLVYETDGMYWKILSYGRDGKPGGVGIDADFFCTNHMFELGTMENAVAHARPTLTQVLSAKQIWTATQVFPLSILGLYLNFLFWGYLLGVPIVEIPTSRFQLIAGTIGIVLLSMIWAYFFAIVLLIPTGH